MTPRRRHMMGPGGKLEPIPEPESDSKLTNETEPGSDIDRFVIELGSETKRQLTTAAAHQRQGQIQVGLFLVFAALEGGELEGLHNNRTIDEIKQMMETPGAVVGEKFKAAMKAPPAELPAGDDDAEVIDAEVVEEIDPREIDPRCTCHIEIHPEIPGNASEFIKSPDCPIHGAEGVREEHEGRSPIEDWDD